MSETPEEQTQEHDGPEPDETATPIQPPDEEPPAEEQESEEVEGHEGEPEPEPQASGAVGAVGEKEIEKMLKRVDSANTTYAKRLADILGEEAGVLETCPRCAAPFFGFIWPPAMRPVSDDVKTAVLLSVGEEPELVTKADPYSRRCDICDGAGRVLTGSKITRERQIRCLRCDGRGWIPVGDERTIPANREQAIPTGAVPVAATNGHDEDFAPAPDQDLWGRDKNHPDYGVHPMYVASR